MKKNLVEELLLEKKIIDPEKLLYDYFYEDVEWFAYKMSDDTMMYVSYELVPQGIGRAFCITVKCSQFTYDIKSKYYSKSFTNDTTGEFTDLSSNFKDKLVSDAMKDLNIWGNQ
jgi:hypothetical protein